jgi:hypothetical protein
MFICWVIIIQAVLRQLTPCFSQCAALSILLTNGTINLLCLLKFAYFLILPLELLGVLCGALTYTCHCTKTYLAVLDIVARSQDWRQAFQSHISLLHRNQTGLRPTQLCLRQHFPRIYSGLSVLRLRMPGALGSPPCMSVWRGAYVQEHYFAFKE